MSRKSEKSHDVWLAGLGALAVAEQEGSDLFQTLVKKGEELEQRLISGSGAASRPKKARHSSALLLGDMVRRELSLDQPGVKADRAEKKRRSELLAPEDVAHRQARRIETAHREFLQELGGPALGELPGDLDRWRREGSIFAVTHRDATYVPGFQLDEKGHPRPAVAQVIELLGDTTSEWGLALWFAAANGWLDGKRPVDLLDSAPEEVVEAAERAAEELVF